LFIGAAMKVAGSELKTWDSISAAIPSRRAGSELGVSRKHATCDTQLHDCIEFAGSSLAIQKPIHIRILHELKHRVPFGKRLDARRAILISAGREKEDRREGGRSPVQGAPGWYRQEQETVSPSREPISGSASGVENR
jgi:hypothetical protein